MSDKPPLAQIKVRIVKAKDKPEFTPLDFQRNEIGYLKMLVHKHFAHAQRFVSEISLTRQTERV